MDTCFPFLAWCPISSLWVGLCGSFSTRWAVLPFIQEMARFCSWTAFLARYLPEDNWGQKDLFILNCFCLSVQSRITLSKTHVGFLGLCKSPALDRSHSHRPLLDRLLLLWSESAVGQHPPGSWKRSCLAGSLWGITLRFLETVVFSERFSKDVPLPLSEVSLKSTPDFLFTVITLRIFCDWKDCPEPYFFLNSAKILNTAHF